MGLVAGSIAIYVAIAVFGLLWTAAILQWGVPDGLRLQDRPHTWATFRERLPLFLGNQLAVVTVTAVGLHLLSPWFVWTYPGWGAMAAGFTLLLLLDDAWVYAWHRSMHESSWLYNNVHRIHHKAFSPLPFEFLYVHPLEWIVGSLAPFAGLAIIVAVSGEISVWTFWPFVVVRTLHEVDAHSGVRSLLTGRLPFYGITEHHDLHHAKPTKGNYASMLTLWDRVFSTYWRPEERAPDGA